MMAQDFHDLTGQVVAKVVNLANDLEAQLVKLLVQAAPPEQAHKVEAALTHSHEAAPIEPKLDGPVVNASGRTDVVANRSRGRRPAGQPRVSDPRQDASVAIPMASRTAVT